MELLNLRISSGPESTLGVLFDLGNPPKRPQMVCYVLEDQYNQPKVPGETRIPPGRYRIKLRTEGGLHQKYGQRFPWHKGMLWLQDVPDFQWVYIHVGNDDDDTEGCLLVGDGQTTNRTARGGVTASVPAYQRLYGMIVPEIESGEVWINIEDYG